MAFLCTETFLTGSDGKAVEGGKTLQNRLASALYNLTRGHGVPGKRTVQITGPDGAQTEAVRAGLNYAKVPPKLSEDDDFLGPGWEKIWDECTIEFADSESGASIHIPSRRIRFGPFFALHKYTITDFEKIILHEYLHAAFRFDNKLKEFHHGMMQQVLIYNHGYKEPANPVAVD